MVCELTLDMFSQSFATDYIAYCKVLRRKLSEGGMNNNEVKLLYKYLKLIMKIFGETEEKSYKLFLEFLELPSNRINVFKTAVKLTEESFQIPKYQ